MSTKNQTTKWIIVKATVVSDTASCDFALLKFNAADIEDFARKDQLATTIKTGNDFFNVSYWSSLVHSWYVDEDELMKDVFEQGASSVLLAPGAEEWIQAKCRRVEDEPETLEIRFYGTGNFVFVGCPRHNSDEYSTDLISVQFLQEL